jgi:hypothetical protein
LAKFSNHELEPTPETPPIVVKVLDSTDTGG